MKVYKLEESEEEVTVLEEGTQQGAAPGKLPRVPNLERKRSEHLR